MSELNPYEPPRDAAPLAPAFTAPTRSAPPPLVWLVPVLLGVAIGVFLLPTLVQPFLDRPEDLRGQHVRAQRIGASLGGFAGLAIGLVVRWTWRRR